MTSEIFFILRDNFFDRYLDPVYHNVLHGLSEVSDTYVHPEFDTEYYYEEEYGMYYPQMMGNGQPFTFKYYPSSESH